MTTYYVGAGGNDGNNGLSWANRKLSLNGAEDIPIAAADVVYVGPGTYRELLTVDVSGSGGSPITYIGDYLGRNTDGVGGVVRITGSDDDQTATRANCILATGQDYRTFTGLAFDGVTGTEVRNTTASSTNWIVQQCYFGSVANYGIQLAAGPMNCTIQNCCFMANGSSGIGIYLTNPAGVDNSGNLIQNCLFLTGLTGFQSDRIGGVTVKNSLFMGRMRGINIGAALTAGQAVTVNNCIFVDNNVALTGTVAGEIVEDYNTFFGNSTDRTNTNTGANSITYPPLFDARWFFQFVNAGAGPYSPLQLISPFDLASYSALLNVAGTSPTTTDMRGTAAQGVQREWGALEYDATLKIFGGIKKGRVRTGY